MVLLPSLKSREPKVKKLRKRNYLKRGKNNSHSRQSNFALEQPWCYRSKFHSLEEKSISPQMLKLGRRKILQF